MNLRRLIPTLFLAVTLSAPALAADPDPLAGMESLMTPQALFGGLISESDISLLFAHLRASMLATAEGHESPPVSPALIQRMDVVGSELRIRGTLAGLALSQIMERAAREALRDFASPGPRHTD